MTVTIARYLSSLSPKTRTARISKGCQSLWRTVQTMQAYIQYVDWYFKVNKTIRCKVLGKKRQEHHELLGPDGGGSGMQS